MGLVLFMSCSIYILSAISTPGVPKHLRIPLTLWSAWWGALAPLRPTCARFATFLWLVAVLAALCIRPDLAGVTSLLRALGLRRCRYYSLLHFFHSDALNLEALTRLWCGGLWRLPSNTRAKCWRRCWVVESPLITKSDSDAGPGD